MWSWLGGDALIRPEAVCTGTVASLEVQTRSAPTCVLLRATRHELQRIVQMTATCVGLGGAQASPSCEPRLDAASAGPEAT